jgi:hypothetical protein
MPHKIIIDGTAQRKHTLTNYRVTIDGNQIDLPFRLFRVFTILSLRRDVNDGWVERSTLSWCSPLVTRYVSRTRTFLRAANWSRPGGVDGAWLVIETNPEKRGHYRLIAKPESIRINPDLVGFDDGVIAREAAAHLRRQKRRGVK